LYLFSCVVWATSLYAACYKKSVLPTIRNLINRSLEKYDFLFDTSGIQIGPPFFPALKFYSSPFSTEIFSLWQHWPRHCMKRPCEVWPIGSSIFPVQLQYTATIVNTWTKFLSSAVADSLTRCVQIQMRLCK
jgi:hypothetical protein